MWTKIWAVLIKFLNGKFIAWYQNQPAIELMGKIYPYLISSATSLLPRVLAHRVSDVICQTQCKMKMHSPVGWGSEPPLPLGLSPQHTRNRWPQGTATSAQDVLGPWTRSRWEAPAKARYSQPKTGQPPPCPASDATGPALDSDPPMPTSRPCQECTWSLGLPPSMPLGSRQQGSYADMCGRGKWKSKGRGKTRSSGAGCKQLKAQKKLQHSQANVKGQVILWIPYILVLLIPLHLRDHQDSDPPSLADPILSLFRKTLYH